MRVLKRHVTVIIDGEPEPVLCGPGPVPDRIAAHITMPGVWADEQLDEPSPVDTGDGDGPSSGDGDTDEIDGDDDGGIVERPAAQAGRTKWAAYAESLDIEVTDDMDKATIRAAVEAAESTDSDEG